MHNMVTVLATASSNWSIDNLLKNATNSAETWGGLLITLIGIILIVGMGVIGGIKLLSGGCQKWAWPLIIIGILIGGIFAVGGYTTLSDIASGGHATIDEFGRSAIN